MGLMAPSSRGTVAATDVSISSSLIYTIAHQFQLKIHSRIVIYVSQDDMSFRLINLQINYGLLKNTVVVW